MELATELKKTYILNAEAGVGGGGEDCMGKFYPIIDYWLYVPDPLIIPFDFPTDHCDFKH